MLLAIGCRRQQTPQVGPPERGDKGGWYIITQPPSVPQIFLFFMKSRNFIFTHNNYTEEDVARYQAVNCSYIVFGYEIAPVTGTPHLQGYIHFENPRSLSAVIKQFKGAHISIPNGPPDAQRKYCTKDGQFYERGTLPMSQVEKGKAGKQAWEEIKALAIAGDIESIPAAYYIPFYRTLKQIADDHYKPDVDFDITYLYLWQTELISKLDMKPDPRKIMWYWSDQGGVGKSTFARYLVKHYDATLLNNAKSQDIAYALPREPKVIVFDLSRTMEGHINYDIMEQIKNGVVFSTKYESRTKFFKVPHMIVFANYEPNKSAWSEDRYFIVKIKMD